MDDTAPAAVLHLEDSDLDADLIRDRLGRCARPLAVDRVSDRPAFVARLAARRYDLILSDYQVPAFEGVEALELAREYQPGVPFIFVSGALGEEVAVETLRRGATDYILKERLARLAPAVERALAEARERAGRRRAEERALAVLESMSEAFVVLDPDWRFAYVNAAYERMSGARREDVLGRVHWEVYPATAGTRLETEFRRAAAEGVTVEFENHYTPWDRWFVVKAYPADGGGVCVQVREVTEAKRAAADLRASEERFRTLFESMDEGYCIIEMIFDPADGGRAVDYRFLEVNPAFEAQSGLRNATGRRMLEFVPSIEAHWLANYGRVALTGEPIRFANEYKTLHRWFDVYAFRLGGAGSRKVAVLFSDITSRKLAEAERERLLAELARREEELRLVTDAVPVLIAYLDADCVYRFANRGYEVWFGRPREQVVGRHMSEVLGEAAYEVIRPNVERVLRGEQHEFVTFAPYREGGRHIQVNYVPRLEGARVVGFYALVADITDRRRAEDMARFVADVSAALAELTDSVSTMQKVAGLSVPTFADWCAVDMVDDAGVPRRVAVTHADPGKLRAYRGLIERYPPRAADPHGVPHVLRTGQPDLLEDIPDALLAATAHDAEHLRLLRGMGLRSHLLVPIRSRGQTLGVVMFLTAESGRRYSPADLMVAQDLAHRSAVAIQNANLYESLREADRKKDEFLATLAHELRNPLAPIRTGLRLMRMANGDGRVVEQARTMMERQTTQLVRLVDDLMDVSRISRGRIELRKERVELAAVVNSAVEASRPLIDQMGHVLSVALPAGPVTLEADATRLAQVFMNLLNNAAKYSDRGGRISLAAERRGGDVVVSVRDTGIGIPADKLEIIFDLFSQVDRSLEKSQGGLGIGLSLVRRLVEMHGGTIEARSAGPGRGSEFVVRLPAAAEPAAPRPSNRDDGPPPSALRILIVDDDRDGADSLAEVLRVMGNDTRTAYDGQEGLDRAAEFRPDVVLFDIGMPKLNGREAARRLREQPWGESVVLIALTGWGQVGDIRQSTDAGFDRHLVKPVDPSDLMTLIAGLRAAPLRAHQVGPDESETDRT